MAEIGIEWVKAYHGRAKNLTNTKAQAEGLLNTLSGTKSFNWGDDLAWDQDFEEQGAGSPGSGTDQVWADTVDIVFFSGHGSSAGPMFGIDSKDDGRAKPAEMRLGNTDLEWAVFDACQVLERDGVFDRLRPAFKGLHYVLGFHTTCRDETQRGNLLGANLNAGDRVRDAWRKACQETEDSATFYAYIRADSSGTDTFNDHWHGKGFVSPDPTGAVTLFYLKASC
jgi:hypothetical protein